MPFIEDFPRLLREVLPDMAVNEREQNLQLYLPYCNFQPIELSSVNDYHDHDTCYNTKRNLEMYRNIMGNVSTLPPDWRLDFAFQLHCLCRREPNQGGNYTRALKDYLLGSFGHPDSFVAVHYSSVYGIYDDLVPNDDKFIALQRRDEAYHLRATASYTLRCTMSAEEADQSLLNIKPTLWTIEMVDEPGYHQRPHMVAASETKNAPWHRIMSVAFPFLLN